MRATRAFLSCTAFAAAIAGMLPACRAPTQVTLQIATTAQCSDVHGTALTVGVDPSDAETRVAAGFVTASTTTCDGASGDIGTLVVTPGDAGRASVIVVAGYNGHDPSDCHPPAYTGCIVARRRFTFTEHVQLVMPILLDPDCVNVPCDAQSTCRKGECFSSATACEGDACSQPGELPDGGTNDDASVIPDASAGDATSSDGSAGKDGSIGGDAGNPLTPYCTSTDNLICDGPSGDPITCVYPGKMCCPSGTLGGAVCSTNECAPTAQYCCKDSDCAPGSQPCSQGLLTPDSDEKLAGRCGGVIGP